MGHIVLGQITAEDIENRMWQSSNPEDTMMVIPGKWKDESAVILFKSESYEYKKQSMAAKVNDDFYFHQRIKLLDKSAITDFSEFTFGDLDKAAYGRQGVFMGIKVVKPDGSEKKINVRKAVQMQGYKNSKERRKVGAGYNKLAIPDLEIGDILDYYYVKISTHIAQTGKRYVFDPVFLTLPTKYPVVKGRIKILPERKCFINISVNNGAPKPVLQSIGKKDYYIIDYGDIEKSKDTYWNCPLRDEPAVKLQVIISGKGFPEKEKYFLGEWEIPKNRVYRAEFNKLLNITVQRPDVNIKLESKAIKFIKNQIPITDTAKFIEDLYYYFRHYLHFEKTMYYGVSYSKYLFVDRFRFIGSFSYLLRRQGIDNEVFIGTKRYMGLIDSVVLLDEISVGLKVKLNGVSKFIYFPNESSVLDEGDFNMEGTKVYAISQKPGSTNAKMFSDTIPVSDRLDNKQCSIVKASFVVESDNRLVVSNSITSYGFTKKSFSWVVNPEDYYPNEYEFMQKIKRFRPSDYSKMDRILDDVDANKRELKETREEMFNAYLNENFSVSESNLDTLIINQPGRFSDSIAMKFSYTYSTSGLTKKAGDYLVLDIGKLMGKNVDFDVDDRERNSDIYMGAPRQYDWEIEVKIPEGYYVDKTDNLEYDVNNSTGSFTSTALSDSSFVRISISKAYNHNYEPVENWPKMLEFLDAANDFFEQKLVLKSK